MYYSNYGLCTPDTKFRRFAPIFRSSVTWPTVPYLFLTVVKAGLGKNVCSFITIAKQSWGRKGRRRNGLHTTCSVISKPRLNDGECVNMLYNL